MNDVDGKCVIFFSVQAIVVRFHRCFHRLFHRARAQSSFTSHINRFVVAIIVHVTSIFSSWRRWKFFIYLFFCIFFSILTVVHHDVVLDTLGGATLELRAATLRGDVVHEGGTSADGFDGGEIYADDGGGHGHVLDGNLEPTARRRAQIHRRARAAEKVIFPVELDELEGGARAEPLLLREVVERICLVS